MPHECLIAGDMALVTWSGFHDARGSVAGYHNDRFVYEVSIRDATNTSALLFTTRAAGLQWSPMLSPLGSGRSPRWLVPYYVEC